MEKFIRVEGVAAPLLRANVDTDTIIPILRLVGLDISGLGQWLFEALRYQSDGKENPDFILNRGPYRESKILLAGPNFGCGSSREGAVTALYQFGIRCVIAPGFGEIFYGNCFKNGLLPIVLNEDIVARIAHGDKPISLIVDLEACAITLPDGDQISFELDAPLREKLLTGADDINETLHHEAAIAAFQTADREKRPWVYGAIQ